MSFSQRIRAYRKALGISQEDLSRRAGINEKYYGRIERGESSPTIDCFLKICQALEIMPAEPFLVELVFGNKESETSYKLATQIVKNFKNDIDIHVNRDLLFEECENVIWFHGFVGSMGFDEFELLIYAVGNIRGELYLDNELVLQINGSDVSSELRKYINDDQQLYQLLEYMSFDPNVLQNKNGNALFLSESNWFSANVVNQRTNEMLYQDIILESDTIINAFSETKLFFDLIFGKISANDSLYRTDL